MRVLIVKRGTQSQVQLTDSLSKRDFEAVFAEDGRQAETILEWPDGPRLAFLEWFLPDMTCLELCRRVRAKSSEPYTYVLLSIPKGVPVNMSDGFDAGADDYIREPYKESELLVRLRAGQRFTELQEYLARLRADSD
jgi:DNA-binding response OmpR family regulator